MAIDNHNWFIYVKKTPKQRQNLKYISIFTYFFSVFTKENMLGNKSVYMLTIVWNERRFVESKSAWHAARRCLYRAANSKFNKVEVNLTMNIFSLFLAQLNIELKNLTNQNNEILHEINRCENDLLKYHEKLQILDNMTELATQSLEVYFQTVNISYTKQV